VDEYLSAQEVSAALRITTGRVYQMVSSGELQAQRVGRALLIPRAELEHRLQQREQKGRAGEGCNGR
jgi:excisionase family DNA binding protein